MARTSDAHTSPETTLDQLNITVQLEYVTGSHVEEGLGALADALLLLYNDPALDAAIALAHTMTTSVLVTRSRSRVLRQTAASLRTQLEAVHHKLDKAA